MAVLIRLARSRGLEETLARFAGVAEWLSEPEHEGFMRALWEWLRQVQVPAYCPGLRLPALVNWREANTMLSQAAKDWSVPYREEGRAEGQALLMRRLAARKFDPATAERLAERLAGITDPERLAEVGEWLLECEHGDELLKRVERLCAVSAAGDGPARG